MASAVAIERQCAPDVGGVGFAPAVSHHGVVDLHAAVRARSRKRQAERAGYRRLGIAGIGRAVSRGVATHRAPRVSGGSLLCQRRGGDEEKRAKARGRQIDQIVKPCRGPAERGVALCAMADHTVGGIDRLVECGAREPANDHPENRRYDRIGEILRQALDGGTGNAGGLEAVGVAADDVCDCRAAGGNAVFFQRRCDIGDMPMQASLRDQRAGEDANSENSKRRS